MIGATYSITSHFPASRVRESSPSRQDRPRLEDWPEEELARIRRVLRRLTALRVRCTEDAEDIVQDTFLTMARRIPELQIRKGLLIWAMGILRNKIGSYYRHRARTLKLEGLEDERQRPRFPALPAMQESTVLAGEMCALVEEILECLSPVEREAITLSLEGLPSGEVARQLKPDLYQTVMTRLYRGRRKIARNLAKHGYGAGRGPRRCGGPR